MRPGASDDGLVKVIDALGERAQPGRPLGPLTTYRVGGPAGVAFEAHSEEDLLLLRRAVCDQEVGILVVGKGSNLLVSDAGFPGVAVILGRGLDGLNIGAVDPTGLALVRAGAALGLPVLARRTVEAGLSGLEWAVGVPGSVGGAVRMNAGGHGSDIHSSLVRFAWMDLSSEAGGEDSPERLNLSYRSSSVAPSEVVLWAEFALSQGDPKRSRAELSEIVQWRRKNQPGGSNAGSIFSNPPGDHAGRLIEAAGLKGLRMGTAEVSTKHANFIQADDEGSADDVWRLIHHVRSVVEERSGVRLETEVRLIGFEDHESVGDIDPRFPVGS